jgi:hypothetical protein
MSVSLLDAGPVSEAQTAPEDAPARLDEGVVVVVVGRVAEAAPGRGGSPSGAETVAKRAAAAKTNDMKAPLRSMSTTVPAGRPRSGMCGQVQTRAE